VLCLGIWKTSSSRLVNNRNDRGSREGRCFLAHPLGYSRHFAERSPVAADRMLVRFSQRFDELREFPLLGPTRSELGASLRGLLMDGYIAFYTIEAERIVIVRVLDGRMDIEQEMSK
jgi:toxin ParE1/3/4